MTYYLGNTLDTRQSLAEMSPLSAVMEIGRLAEKLKSGKAPEPGADAARQKKTPPKKIPEPVRPLSTSATASTLTSREAAKNRDYKAFKAAQRRGGVNRRSPPWQTMILTNQEISFKNLMVLENSISFTKKVVRRYDDKFGRAGAKIGYILNIRKPARSVSTAGQGIQLQDYIERSVPLVLNKQYQQACAFTSSDLALSLDDFTNRVTKPKIVQLGNDIDYDGLQQFSNVPAEVGTPGTVPNTPDTYLNALQIHGR